MKRKIYLGFALFVFGCFAMSAYLQALDATVLHTNGMWMRYLSNGILFTGLLASSVGVMAYGIVMGTREEDRPATLDQYMDVERSRNK